jgi:hypothetical protein
LLALAHPSVGLSIDTAMTTTENNRRRMATSRVKDNDRAGAPHGLVFYEWDEIRGRFLIWINAGRKSLSPN